MDAAPKIRRLPTKETLPNVLGSLEKVRRLLDTAEKHSQHMHLLIAFALYTGMRAGEILDLDWDDVDLDAEVLRVRNPKNRKERIVHLGSTLLSLLEKVPDSEREGAIIVSPQSGTHLQH